MNYYNEISELENVSVNGRDAEYFNEKEGVWESLSYFDKETEDYMEAEEIEDLEGEEKEIFVDINEYEDTLELLSKTKG